MTTQERYLNARGDAMAKLDALGIDALCAEIIDGKSYSDITGELGISNASLAYWLTGDVDRSARVNIARRTASITYDDEALAVLKDPQWEPQRAREIAQHLRWRASKVAPDDYGDRLKVDQTTKFENLPEDAIAARLALIQKQMADAAPSTGEAQHEGGA